MITLRRIVSTLCLGTCLAVPVCHAADAPDAPPPPPHGGAGPGWHGHGGGPLGAHGRLLHKLNLTADQKTQIRSILAGEKSQFEALHTSVEANMKALETTAPNDGAYPALLETAKANAATRINLESETWKQIYESVLTKTQQGAIPAIIAAEQAARQQEMHQGRAEHEAPGTAPAN
jgi:Spy/CpxP family protein refolding chaperone